MKKLLIILIQIFVASQNYGQCNVENLDAPTTMSSGFGGGQQFVACQSGLLEEIEFKTLSWVTSPITLNLKDASCNTIWSVSGIVAGPNQIINVDLSNGSGTSRNLTNGLTYQFHIPVSGSNTFSISVDNPYPDGEAINNSICSESIADLWFRVGIGQTLPVELISFTGRDLENEIGLNWETASEINNLGFEIQKSKDGRNWEIIDFIEGKGTTNEVNEYYFQDSSPFLGINYYRLKQIDYDGVFEFSKVIAVRYENSDKNIRVFPNPSNRLINIQIDNPSSQRMKVRITDNLGRNIWKNEFIEGESNWRREMEIDGNGIYFIAAQIGDKIYYERVIILDEK